MNGKTLKLGAAAAIVSVLSLLSTTMASAAPATPPAAADARGYDGYTDLIVGVGSSVTYPIERAFEDIYNRQDGCNQSPTDVGVGGVQNEYNECSNGSETVGDTESENWDHDGVHNAFPTRGNRGSGELGFGDSDPAHRQLADGAGHVGCDTDPAGYDVDFASSSTEQGVGAIQNCLTFLGYAKDALVILTFQGRAQLDFNIGAGGDLDLANLFSNQDGQCLTRTWSELTGNPADTARVEVYGVLTGSSAYVNFNNAIPGDPNACAAAQGHPACLENNVTTNAVSGCSAANLNHVNSIWWGSYGTLATFPIVRGSASLSNGVDGIVASANSIAGTGDEVYPLPYMLWRVNRTAHVDVDATFNATYTAAAGGRGGAAAAYTEWLCRNGNHGVDPYTGTNVDVLIASEIQANNFVRTPLSQIGLNPYGRCLVDY